MSLCSLVELTCWVLKFMRCSSKISSVVLSDFPRFCRIWGMVSYCNAKFAVETIEINRTEDFLSPFISDHVLPWHTSCQHIADTFHASSSPHKKIQLSISLLLLGKTVFAGGFRTLSELVGWLRVRRLRSSFSRPQDCFGIDARGSELFPGRGHYVPTRARHTLAHFSLQ